MARLRQLAGAAARGHVPAVVLAEVEEEAARLPAVLEEGPQVLAREVGHDGLPRGVREARRAHGRAHDGELDDLAAVVAALAARAHRDEPLAQLRAHHRVGPHQRSLLTEPSEREASRLAVRVADDRELGGLALVI